jgi:chromosome segregation ATPase
MPETDEKKVDNAAYPPATAGSQPDPKLATLAQEIDSLKAEKATLEKEKASLMQKVDELSKQLAAIDKMEVDKLLNSIVDGRIAKGLSKVEDKTKDIERLTKLSKTELTVLKEDIEKLSVQPPVGDPKPKTAGVQPTEAERNLSEMEAKRRTIRKEYFGHEDALK